MINATLSPQELFHGVTWYRVEEQEQKQDQTDRDHGLQDSPLVVVPDYVLDGFQRIEKPHERSVRPTVRVKNMQNNFLK